LAHITTPGELQGLVQESQEFDDWLDYHMEDLRGEDLETGEAKTMDCPFTGKPIDHAEARKLKLDVKHNLQAATARREYFAKQADYDRLLLDKVPSLKDPKSQWSQAIAETVTQLPEIKRVPSWKISALCASVGKTLLEASGHDFEKTVAAVADALREQKETGKGSNLDSKNQRNNPKVPKVETGKLRPRRPRSRPVPAMRRTTPTTQRPVETDSIDTNEDFVNAIEARMG
jgi:hypothetical protein